MTDDLRALIEALPETPKCICGHYSTEHFAGHCGRCPGDEDGPWCDSFREVLR